MRQLASSEPWEGGIGGCRLRGEGSFNLRKLAWCHGVNTRSAFQLKADSLFPSIEFIKAESQTLLLALPVMEVHPRGAGHLHCGSEALTTSVHLYAVNLL